MDRHLIAYLLIALILGAIAARIAWNMHNSRDRVIGRRRRREEGRGTRR